MALEPFVQMGGHGILFVTPEETRREIAKLDVPIRTVEGPIYQSIEGKI